MSDTKTYSSYAVLCELNSREFKRKLGMFPAEMRHYVVLAAGIIGAELAKRVEETPEAVAEDGKEFVSELLGIVDPQQDDAFRDILEKYLIETMKDELRFCCSNCANFNLCLELENTSAGLLFKRRAEGEETDELKKEIALRVEHALQRTPYIDTDRANILCKNFRHQHSAATIGEVFGRYSDIAAGLQTLYGIDYKRILNEMILINMVFCKKG